MVHFEKKIFFVDNIQNICSYDDQIPFKNLVMIKSQSNSCILHFLNESKKIIFHEESTLKITRKSVQN